jgi:hypothetical protein
MPRNGDGFERSWSGLHRADSRCRDGNNTHPFRGRAWQHADRTHKSTKVSRRRSGMASTIHVLAAEPPDFGTGVGSRTEPRGFFRFRAIVEVAPLSPTGLAEPRSVEAPPHQGNPLPISQVAYVGGADAAISGVQMRRDYHMHLCQRCASRCLLQCSVAKTLCEFSSS